VLPLNSSRKYPYSSHRGYWNFMGVGVASLEFPGERGGLTFQKSLPWRRFGYLIFSGTTRTHFNKITVKKVLIL